MTDIDKPLVTVVIASYNHRNYVEKAIISVLSQDYHKIELLVIDDGSTDGSGEFLETLKEKYKFHLIHRQNGGLVSVLNLGIQEANGEYVVFHASDDVSMPGRISGQVGVLERHPSSAFVSGNVAFVTESGRSRGELLKITDNEIEFGFDELFLLRAHVSSVACMYRASSLKEMGEISDKYRAEDPQIFLRLTRLGYSWVQWAGQPVIAYRMLFTSQSRTIMPLLLRQQLQLVNEYSDHPHHKKALSKVKTCLISALAEQDKCLAWQELKYGGVDWFSWRFIRVIVKMAMPREWQTIFKRSGVPR